MAGSFEVASSLALQELYAAGPDPAAAYTLLAHTLILFVMVVPGLISFWLKGIKLKTIKKLKDQEE